MKNSELAERFAEIHPPFDPPSALTEANRCLYCFDAPCAAACPTHIDVPRFIKKIAQANLPGSALTILDANILGASCSRVCPVEILCEGACVYHACHQPPIQIARLQRYSMDHFLSDFFAGRAALPYQPARERRGKIACIGAGPASLACAAELRRRGFAVTLFERRALPGGLNTYGVAEYKLRSADSLREIDMIRALGVEFHFDKEISSEPELSRLEREFAAIFLGIGLGAMFRLEIPGEKLAGVIDALQFIERYKTKGGLAVGSKMVVVGGGNTAIDAARAALRLGAQEVHLVYRRGPQQMPAFASEFSQAREEGVRVHWFAQPVRIHASAEGSGIEGIECVRVEPSSKGLAPVEGSSFRIPCDTVIPGIGQSALIEFLESCRGVRFENGRVQIDRATGQTANPRYFAGGDCVNGGREVVDAVADGKRAARGIAQALEAAHDRA